ncbi:MAG: pilus assembly protein N-terminal domain-containing protein [Acidobacteriia bacterium]|nr:pilus assembly protein N-terminal domain-containing protein [Terriglobia bacterium]
MTSSRAVRIAILLCLFVVLAAELPCAAAPPQTAAAPEGQVLHIFTGKSVVINMQSRMTRVLSSNPVVIETLATSPTQVVVEGKSAGKSSLILWDETGHSQILDVVVDPDLSGLRAAIQHAYPDEQIAVQADGSHLILSGNVPDAHTSEDLGKMAGLYSTQVVNSLLVSVTHERQVLLEVKFAEVDRTRLEQFGINILNVGATNTIGSLSTQQFGPPTSASTSGSGSGGGGGGSSGSSLSGRGSITVPDLLNIFIFRPDMNLGVTIKDLQQKSILQILAEPNLMALNGQKASFLAGGEFPVPVVQGGQNIGMVTIQFRPFGVKLEFTGYIGKDNILRLHVAPEVSALDYTNAVTISGFTVPALSTRRAETEIELKDGQSFGIAGLLDHRLQTQMSKIPGIGDIPVLGQLFRSRTINRSNTELLVLVTPHIIDPVRDQAAAPALPTLPLPFLDVPKYDKTIPGASKAAPPAPVSSKQP